MLIYLYYFNDLGTANTNIATNTTNISTNTTNISTLNTNTVKKTNLVYAEKDITLTFSANPYTSFGPSTMGLSNFNNCLISIYVKTWNYLPNMYILNSASCQVSIYDMYNGKYITGTNVSLKVRIIRYA